MPAFISLVENLLSLFEGAWEAISATGLFDRVSFDYVITGLRDWGRRPDAAFWLPIAWAEGTRREGLCSGLTL